MKRSTFSKTSITTGLILAIAMALTSRAEAQEEAPQSDEKTWQSPFFSPKIGNLYFLGGVRILDVDELNDALKDNGYTTLKTPSLSLGLGTDMSIGRLIIGGEWHWLRNVGTDAKRNDLRADMSSKYWLFRMGIDLAKWRGLRIYPLFGIGAGTTTFYIAREEGERFQDVLDTPAREVRLRQKGLLLDASLGIDYRFKVRETEYKSSFFTIGLRGGYLFSPYSGNWKTATAEISGGPDIFATGPNVQLLLGISGERKKHHTYKKNKHL